MSKLNCLPKRCQRRDGLGKNWEALVGFKGQEGHSLVCSVPHSGVILPPRMADRNLSLHSELHLPYAVIDVVN